MRFLFMWVILVLMLSFFGIGKSLYQEDNTQDIYNYTESKLDWDNITGDRYSIDNFNITKDMNQSDVDIIHFKRVFYRGIDNIGFILMEVAKWGVEWGFNKPDWNYLRFAKILIYVIIGLYVFAILPVLIPIIALAYLSFIGIKNMSRWFKTKISKRKLKKT